MYVYTIISTYIAYYIALHYTKLYIMMRVSAAYGQTPLANARS